MRVKLLRNRTRIRLTTSDLSESFYDISYHDCTLITVLIPYFAIPYWLDPCTFWPACTAKTF